MGWDGETSEKESIGSRLHWTGYVHINSFCENGEGLIQ